MNSPIDPSEFFAAGERANFVRFVAWTRSQPIRTAAQLPLKFEAFLPRPFRSLGDAASLPFRRGGLDRVSRLPPALHPAVEGHRPHVAHGAHGVGGEGRDLPELAAGDDAHGRVGKCLVSMRASVRSICESTGSITTPAQVSPHAIT